MLRLLYFPLLRDSTAQFSSIHQIYNFGLHCKDYCQLQIESTTALPSPPTTFLHLVHSICRLQSTPAVASMIPQGSRSPWGLLLHPHHRHQLKVQSLPQHPCLPTIDEYTDTKSPQQHHRHQQTSSPLSIFSETSLIHTTTTFQTWPPIIVATLGAPPTRLVRKSSMHEAEKSLTLDAILGSNACNVVPEGH